MTTLIVGFGLAIARLSQYIAKENEKAEVKFVEGGVV